MSGVIVVIIVVAVVIVLAAIAFAVWQHRQRKQTEALKSQFGPEYERAHQALGKNTNEALESRKEKIEQYDIRDLTPEEQQRFTQQWTTVQARFVDDPGDAVVQADNIIREVMVTVGYPAGSFEQREEAASVRYPERVQDFRKAHRIAVTQSTSGASTEDLRKAMLLYRSLFDQLVGTQQRETVAAH